MVEQISSSLPIAFSPQILPTKQQKRESFFAPVVKTFQGLEGQIKVSPYFFTGLFDRDYKITYEHPDDQGAPTEFEENVTLNQSRKAFLHDSQLAQATTRGPMIDGDLQVIQQIIPSIVRISVKSEADEKWYGSGVIVEPTDIIPDYIPKQGEYFILTNNHVAENAKYMSVRLANKMEVPASVVESIYGTKLLDPKMDVGLVRIVVPYSLPTARIGNPKELLAGQTIYTAGHPQALPNTVITKGIVSNPAQETGELSLDVEMDAPINPGNSGGPSFNQNGEIVGLNTYTFRSGEDLTFVKPIDEQIETLRKLWDNGEIIRGSLGFEVIDFPLIKRQESGFPEGETGAAVLNVTPGSTAEKAGLVVGDIITWMEVRENGVATDMLKVDVTDSFEAQGIIKRWLAKQKPGSEVAMIIYRKEFSKDGAHFNTKELRMQVETMD